MFEYHYWKCYSVEEGIRKITIFTKDVDYYIWGTCAHSGSHLSTSMPWVTGSVSDPTISSNPLYCGDRCTQCTGQGEVSHGSRIVSRTIEQ